MGPIAQIKHQSGTWGLAAPESGGILHGAQLPWPLGRAHCSRSSPRVTWGPGGSPGHSWVAWLCSGFSGSAGPSADKHSANGFIMHCWTPITPTTKHAKHFLDEGKIEIDYKDINAYYRSGPEQRSLHINYCRRDCELPMRLAKKLKTIQELAEFSQVACTVLQSLVRSGQQVRTMNMLVMLRSSNARSMSSGSYFGRMCVVPPKNGPAKALMKPAPL